MEKTKTNYELPQLKLSGLTSDSILCMSSKGTEVYQIENNPDWF